MADPNINDQVEAALESLGIDPDSIVLPGGGTVANASKESLNSAGLAQSVTPTDVTSGAAAASGGSSNIGSELLAAPGMISSTSSMFKGTPVDSLKSVKDSVAANLQQLQTSKDYSALQDANNQLTRSTTSLNNINGKITDQQNLLDGVNSDYADVKTDYDIASKEAATLVSSSSPYNPDVLRIFQQEAANDAKQLNDLTKSAQSYQNNIDTLRQNADFAGDQVVDLSSKVNSLSSEFPSSLVTDPLTGAALPSAPPPSVAQAQGWENSAQKSLNDATANQKQPTSLFGKVNQKINQLLKNPYVAGLAAAGTGFLFFESAKSLFTKFSIGGLTGAVASFAGFWKSMSALNSIFGNSSFSFLHNLFFHLTSTPGILIIAGALLLLAFLLTSKPNTTPSAVEEPLVTMPTVWTSKAVVFMTAGIAMSTLGVLTGPTAPLSQTLTIPAVALTTALNSSQLTDSSGNAVGAGAYSLYNTVFVQSGTGNNPDEAIYVTQGANGQAVVNAVTLKSGLKFSAPSSPQAAYINFVQTNSNGTWSANPKVVQALNAENALTTASNAVGGVSGSNAIQMAGAANKTATPSTGN